MDVSGLVTTNVPNTKIGEVENKIPHTTGLVTTAVLNTKIKEVENKIPDVSGLVRKTDYDVKILDIEKKFTTFDYNTFTKEILDAKIKEKKLVDVFDISNLVKNSDLNKTCNISNKSRIKRRVR